MKNGTPGDRPKALKLPQPQPLSKELTPKRRVVEREIVVSLAELDQIRAQVAQARGSQKLRLLLDAPIPGAVIQRMPPQELMMTFKDIGKADCAELIELATPEQLAVCLDLDCWDKDHFKLEELDDWLGFLASGVLVSGFFASGFFSASPFPPAFGFFSGPLAPLLAPAAGAALPSLALLAAGRSARLSAGLKAAGLSLEAPALADFSTLTTPPGLLAGAAVLAVAENAGDLGAFASASLG